MNKGIKILQTFGISIILITLFSAIMKAESVEIINNSKPVKWYSKADSLQVFNLKLAKVYLDSCFDFIKLNPDPEWMAKCTYLSGVIDKMEFNYDSALRKAIESRSYFYENNDWLFLANTFYLSGACKLRQSNFSDAISDLIYSQSIFDSLHIQSKSIEAQNAIGSCFYQLGDYQTAGKYYQKVYDYADSVKDSLMLVISLNNLANVNSEVENKITTTTLNYYNKAISICEQTGDESRLLSLYTNLATCYVDMSNADSGLFYLQKARKLSNNKYHNTDTKILIDLYTGILYKKQHKYDSSLFYLNQGIDYSLASHTFLNLSDLYAQKAEVLKAYKGVLVAYPYLQLALNYKDSVWNKHTLETVAEIEGKYQSKENEREIKLKQSKIESQLSLIHEQHTRNVILMIAVVIFVILLLVILFYSRKVNFSNEKLKMSNQLMTENNLLLEQAVSTRDRLLSVLAHDIKNPLSSINGFAELISESKEPLSTKVRFHAKQISLSADSLNQLLDNLLKWAQNQKEQIVIEPENLNVFELAENTIQLLKHMATEKNIQLLNQCQRELTVYSDNLTTQTILRNILSNAIKFTPQNGTVIIETKVKADKVAIEIVDTGRGIKKEDIPLLFSPMVNRQMIGSGQNKGIGLGLIVCDEFVQLNHGAIEVTSKLGKGSCFSVYLPIQPSSI